MRISSIFLCLIAAGAVTPRPASAQVTEPSPRFQVVEGKITFQVRNRPLREVLRLLPEGLAYRVESDVPNLPLSLTVREVTPLSGLQLLVRQAAAADPRIQMARDAGAWRIFLGEPPLKVEKPVPLALAPNHPLMVALLQRSAVKRFTANLQQVTLYDALNRLLAGSGLPYIITPEVKSLLITVRLRDASPVTALEALLCAANQAAGEGAVEGLKPGAPPRVELTMEDDVLIVRAPLKK